MAHHVAELIDGAKNGKTRAERAASKHNAVETILRIWEHRAASDRINPFADLMPTLKVLRTLTDELPPWAHIPVGRLGGGARRTYDLLRCLTICLSFIELDAVKAARRGLTRARRPAKYLSKQEQEFLAHLALWLDAFTPPGETSKKPARKVAKGGGQKEGPQAFSRIAIGIVDEIGTAIVELKDELQKLERQRTPRLRHRRPAQDPVGASR
jgi:hypothetical protein